MRRNDQYLPATAQREQRGLSPYGQGSLVSPFFGGSPWQAMRRMQEDMDRIFGQFFGGQNAPGGPLAQVQQWQPSVDVSQTDKEWLIEVDLPGVSKDNIDVQVHNDYLVLRAQLHQETPPAESENAGETSNRQYHLRERRYGYFERVLALPENVDEENISCEFTNGLLKVHVPKTAQPEARGRRIPISDANATPQVTAGEQNTNAETTAAS
jgi:HSP20 family protein